MILLTIRDAAKEASMSRSYIDGQIRLGLLTARKIGRAVRIERSELERWIRAQPVKNAVSAKGISHLNTEDGGKGGLHVAEK